MRTVFPDFLSVDNVYATRLRKGSMVAALQIVDTLNVGSMMCFCYGFDGRFFFADYTSSNDTTPHC